MITGFCFSTPGKDIEILNPDDLGDFYVMLRGWMRQKGSHTVAMRPDFFQQVPYLVKDIIKARFDVLIVDTSWSPLDLDVVMPVLVHRNINTLAQHVDNAVCCGSLIPDLMRLRSITEIQVKYIAEGDVLQHVDMSKKSGWGASSTTADKHDVPLSRVYQYRPERDYEIAEKKKK